MATSPSSHTRNPHMVTEPAAASLCILSIVTSFFPVQPGKSQKARTAFISVKSEAQFYLLSLRGHKHQELNEVRSLKFVARLFLYPLLNRAFYPGGLALFLPFDFSLKSLLKNRVECRNKNQRQERRDRETADDGDRKRCLRRVPAHAKRHRKEPKYCG